MTTFEERLKEALSHSYNLERELGGGGMSRVFVAVDRSLGRRIVVKVLSPELIADVNRGRFQREIKVAAQLTHPHIVPLLSAGEHEDLVWYTMPFISGESLRSAVEKHGPMSVTEVVRVLYHVGEALDYAHGEGVIHRDIKAANILRSGTYSLVTDFGVAKALNASMPAAGMTQTGTAIGTPAYMAPEQLAGDPTADHRIDIYAVGLLAYELLNGRSPFAATTPAKVLVAVLSEDPKPLVDVRPDVPRSLSELVMQCLSKEPEGRPATARILLNALDRFSTASGELRTMEHKIPRLETTILTVVPPITGLIARTPTTEQVPASEQIPASPTTAPVAVSATSPENDAVSVAEPTTGGEFEPYKRERTMGRRTQMLVGGVALLIPIIAGAIFLTRSSNKSSAVPASPAPIPSVTQPVTAPQNVAVAPLVDSQAIADSIKNAKAEAAKRAVARRDSLNADSTKRAAAKKDSLRKAQQTIGGRARTAVAALLSNAFASKTVAEAATHKGGLLGSQRKGDLQTQINALMPWLRQQGLTYDQFKSSVAESGAKVFDEFGRMTTEGLQQFAGVSR